MKDGRAVDTATLEWWEELEHLKKEHWCCNILKEGAFEEHLRLEFDFILPVKFGVNFCCQCGDPIIEGHNKAADEKEDWCCRLMNKLGFEWLEFEGHNKEIYTMRVSHCFNGGRELKKHNGGWKFHNSEDCDKCG